MISLKTLNRYLISLFIGFGIITSSYAYKVHIVEKYTVPLFNNFSYWHYYIYDYKNVKSWTITQDSFTITTYDGQTFSRTFNGDTDFISHYKVLPENVKEKAV